MAEENKRCFDTGVVKHTQVSMVDGYIDDKTNTEVFLEWSLAIAKSEKAMIDKRVEALEIALEKERARKWSI